MMCGEFYDLFLDVLVVMDICCPVQREAYLAKVKNKTKHLPLALSSVLYSGLHRGCYECLL